MMSSIEESSVKAEYDDETIDKLLEVVVPLVKKVGDIVKNALSSREKRVEEKSSSTDLVTETDKAVEVLLVDGIKCKFPNHKFIGEEDVAMNRNNVLDEVTADPTWIIDPIDGTMNFVHGHPMVCISLGLIVKRIPLIGIVHVPTTDRFYHAVRTRGAFLNGDKIKVSDVKELSKAMVLMEVWSSSPIPNWNVRQTENIAKLIHKAHAMRTVGSAAINLAMVANGEADVYPQVGIRCWDMVAGGLIVKEAGGVLLDPRDGSSYDYMSRGVLAAATHQLAKEVLALDLKYPEFPRDQEDKFGA